MTDVNQYYLGSLERIFGAELEEGLITFQEARDVTLPPNVSLDVDFDACDTTQL